MEKTPGEVRGVARLKEWAINPAEGGKIFRWSEPGDYERCIEFYRSKLPERMLHGWCQNLHIAATSRPAGHAPGVEEAMAEAKHAATEARKK